MPITKPRLSTNINTDVGTFTDPILVLHQGATSADVDVGFLMNRSNGLTANAAVVWQESSKSFVHILTNSSGAADANLVVQSYANVSVGNVLLINNAGIYVDGTIGSPGQVLASDGSKTFWAAPGGFTGGTVPNPSVFQSNVVFSSTTNSTNSTTGAVVVLGGVGISGNVTFAGNSTHAGKFIVNEATNSEPYIMGSGAFHVAGGMSIGKDFWIGGNLYVANVISQTSTIIQVNDPLVYLKGNNNPYNYDIGVFSDFTGGSYGLNQYTGAVRSYQTNEWVFFSNIDIAPAAGSVGLTNSNVIYDPVKVGNLIAANTTPSTSTNTGALIVRGGAGIAGNVYTDRVYTTNGVYWAGNGQAFTSTTIANTTEIVANISSGQNVGLNLTATGVVAGNYGSATSIPTIVVDSKGRITSVTSNVVSTTITLAGGSGSGSVAGGGTLTIAGTSNQITTAVSGSTITIALAQNITAPGNVTVTGNLVVQGNTTTLNTETLTIEDLNITVANGAINAAAADGAGLTVGGANARFLYKSATDSWVLDRGVFASGNLVANSGTVSSSVTSGALVVTGGAGISGALHIQQTGDVSANIGTLFTGNNVTNANLGAYQTFANANVVAIQANIGAFYNYANTKIGTNTNSNLVVVATTTSTSTTTGALIVNGGAGIAGNLNVGSGTSGYKATFASPGAGTSGVMFINASLNSSGNGLVISSTTRTVSDNSVPLLHIIARDGAVALSTTVQGNTVIGSTTTSTSTTTGALVVAGGAGIAGNVYIGATADQSVFLNSYPEWSANAVRQTARWTTSTTTPIGSILGDMWYDSSTDILYEYINDGTNSIWVDVSSAFGNNFVTLSGVTVTATGNAQAISTTTGDLRVTGGVSITTGNLYIGGSGGRAIVATGNIVPSSNLSIQNNLGSDTLWWNNFYGVSTQARYADLAENYLSDYRYSFGTVVSFGGEQEITISTITHDPRVAGVISQNPAHLMNGALVGDDVLPLALQGRVPCRVKGPIAKGDLLVSSDIPGTACKLDKNKFEHGCLIGKSLDNIDDDSIKIIEVVVGRD
jgi:hypothetical protein